MLKLKLYSENNNHLNNLCGAYNQHLQQIEKYLDVVITNRSNEFVIK